MDVVVLMYENQDENIVHVVGVYANEAAAVAAMNAEIGEGVTEEVEVYDDLTDEEIDEYRDSLLERYSLTKVPLQG
jgi:hypothetical protein